MPSPGLAGPELPGWKLCTFAIRNPHEGACTSHGVPFLGIPTEAPNIKLVV